MNFDSTHVRKYDPFSLAVIIGSIGAGFGASKLMESQKNQAAKQTRASEAAQRQQQQQVSKQ